ncbi:MAG: ABC transporter substrate-binding protein [Candidatus Bathyarchaeia archaeon]
MEPLERGEVKLKVLFVVFLLAVFLVISTSSIPETAAQQPVQPPVITTTMYVGTSIFGPRRADPVRVYDTGSGALLFNVYDTLIFFKGELYWEFEPRLATNVPSKADGTIVDVTKTVTSTDVNLADPTGSTWSDGSTCIGWVDSHTNGELDEIDGMYMIESDGSYRTWQVQTLTVGPPVSVTLIRQKWIFHIRTQSLDENPIRFVDEGGSVADTFDVYDAEYSLERGLVQDQLPMWMFYKPLFDQMNSDSFDSNVTHPTAMDLAHLIDNAIEVDGNDLIINLGMLFPEIAFKQILSQTWGSIVSREFSISIGCWDGDLYTDSDGDGYPDWWTSVRRILRSPYDKIETIPRPPGVTFTNGYRYVGTGPYRVITFDAINYKIELAKNSYYWGGWEGKHLEKIVILYITEWTKRRETFLNGEVDVCAVPRQVMFDLLDPETGEPWKPGIITIKRISPVIEMSALHFEFTLSPESPFIAKRKDTSEPLPNFFNNTHVRKAFCYAFDHKKYIDEVYFGEAVCRNNMLIYGLVPDYYNTTIPGYDINSTKAMEELQAVVFPDGKTLYETGFTATLTYYVGSESERKACEMIKAFFQDLGPQFEIQIYANAPFGGFVDGSWPTWIVGWLVDFADADNFASAYMYSCGDFAYIQNYTAWNGWTTKGPKTGLTKDEIIEKALKTPDGPERKILYEDLQWIYYQDAPFIPIAQPLTRRWQWYWVKGWYYNPLHPGDYYYSIYKEGTCWADVTGQTAGTPDGACNMRDIGYVAQRFGAKAPEPGKTPTSKWVGTYGVGGPDVYGDRRIDMRDIGYACKHFGHTAQP